MDVLGPNGLAGGTVAPKKFEAAVWPDVFRSLLLRQRENEER